MRFIHSGGASSALHTWPVTWLYAVHKMYFIYEFILIVLKCIFKNTYVKCILIIQAYFIIYNPVYYIDYLNLLFKNRKLERYDCIIIRDIG